MAFPDEPERITAHDGRYSIGACLWAWATVEDTADDVTRNTLSVRYHGDPAVVTNAVVAVLDLARDILDPAGEHGLSFHLADADGTAARHDRRSDPTTARWRRR